MPETLANGMNQNQKLESFIDSSDNSVSLRNHLKLGINFKMELT